MGVFTWPVRLDSMDGQRSLELEAMVDTGPSYTIVPAPRHSRCLIRHSREGGNLPPLYRSAMEQGPADWGRCTG